MAEQSGKPDIHGSKPIHSSSYDEYLMHKVFSVVDDKKAKNELWVSVKIQNSYKY